MADGEGKGEGEGESTTITGGAGGDGDKGGEGGAGSGGDKGGESGGDKGGEGGAGGEGDKLPESYEFKAPEGVEANEEQTKALSEFAKANKLTQEAAQALYERELKSQTDAEKAAAEAFNKQREEWVSAVEKDAEYGGTAFKENLQHVVAARDKFATPELVKLLDETGLGDNPELVRFFYRVGKAMSEDSFAAGGGEGGGEKKPPEKVLYG